MGITKLGKGTKLMVVAEGEGLPIGMLADSAGKAEISLAEPAMDTVAVPRSAGVTLRRPWELVADKAYDSDAFRRWLRRKGIRPVIPFRSNRKPRRGPKPDLSGYRSRWKIERTNAWIQSFRRLQTRYERAIRRFLAFVHIACAIICLRRLLE